MTKTIIATSKVSHVSKHHVDMARRIDGNAARASYNFARGVVREAKIRVPKRTGYLASQIKWRRDSFGKFTVYVDGSVQMNTGAFYAVYVEYGTRHMAAQPYFRPAVEMMKAEWRREMRAVFR